MDRVHADGEAVNLGVELAPGPSVNLADVRPWAFFVRGQPDPLAIPCDVRGVEARAICPWFTTRELGEAFRESARLSCRPLPTGAVLRRLRLMEIRDIVKWAERCGVALVFDCGPLPSLAKWN